MFSQKTHKKLKTQQNLKTHPAGIFERCRFLNTGCPFL